MAAITLNTPRKHRNGNGGAMKPYVVASGVAIPAGAFVGLTAAGFLTNWTVVTAGSGASATTKVTGLPSDVAEYAAKNPADKGGISLRAKLFPEYQVYKAQGGGINTFERFVQSELAAQASQGVAVE